VHVRPARREARLRSPPHRADVRQPARQRGWARFELVDTGPGISPEDLPHLFEPYWSSRRHAKQGTGLGLYISKGIVEAHGGKLSVESTPGAGSTFCVELPTV
jgi:signal transduction histidine kinase